MIDSNIPDDLFPPPPDRDVHPMLNPFEMLEQLHGGMGIQHYILDENRNLVAVDTATWAAWCERTHGEEFERLCRVGRTYIGPIDVSTVFLAAGIDLSWGQGKPQFFETMVFGGLKFNDMQYRWSTWEEAEAGHAAIVAMVRSYYRWWRVAYEHVATWLLAAWENSKLENEWDWSTRRWIHNVGAEEARDMRTEREIAWYRQQLADAQAADASFR